MRRIMQILVNRRILNNVFFNNFLIIFRLDRSFSKYVNAYNFHNDKVKEKEDSLQEIAGYSKSLQMEEVLAELHSSISTKICDLKPGNKILDIGCGPGLFLNNIPSGIEITGIDVTPGMIKLASAQVPLGTFICGDFLDVKLKDGDFDLVFSVGTLMYIAPSKIKQFFHKVSIVLKSGGYVIISYPHAITRKDLFFPDLNYIQYSPTHINKLCLKFFEVIEHHRILDGKIIGLYDEQPFINPQNQAYKTYRNSSLLILKKR